MMSVRLYGLRACIRRFSENGKYAQCGKWSMGRGGYDEWFSLYYDESAEKARGFSRGMRGGSLEFAQAIEEGRFATAGNSFW